VAITYGTTLNQSQLNAASNVPGTFKYTPSEGTLLPAGTHTLTVAFAPADGSLYSAVSGTVTLIVHKASPHIIWQPPSGIPSGTPLSSGQLTATASIPGSFSYNPAAGTVLSPGEQTLTVTFTPTDLSNYSATTARVPLEVSPAVPVQLDLTVADHAIPVGKSTTLNAVVLYSDGDRTDATDSALFTANPEGIIRLTKTGGASCLARGAVQITAALGSASASANVTCMQVLHQQPFSTIPDEFAGPFSNWYDVKRDFGAKGDGVTDDSAAIQKGLSAISTSHDKADVAVLWFPAGKYRITSTLTMAGKNGVSVIGEDPTTTTIAWDGPKGGTMIFTSGITRSRMLRITMDGSNSADTGFNVFWDAQTPYYPAFIYLTDMIFEDMAYALRVGFGGPVAIERVRFSNLSSAAISLENWNAGEVWVRDSLFERCRIGLTNLNGAGQFNAYGNVFISSSNADMRIGNPQYFSARGNTSIGSKAFFIADPAGRNGAQVVIQDNLIVDPSSTPITVGNQGPLLLVDNTILLPAGATFPVIVADDFGTISSDVFTLGNIYTTSKILSGNVGRSMSIDDQVAQREEFSIEAPVAAPFLPNLHRQVIDVPVYWTTSQIQRALDSAGAQAGSHVVLHFINGHHLLTDTLVVSGSNDVQLVGDGLNSSALKWIGQPDRPMLSIEHPAKATIRNLQFYGSTSANGIEVKVNDTPGSRVTLFGIDTSGTSQGVVSEGLDQAIVEARSTAIAGNSIGVKIAGGISGQTKATTFGGYRSFGGSDGSWGLDGYTYDVQSGGQIIIEDTWRDASGGSPNFVHLTDSGTLSLECGLYATPGTAAFSIDGFNGDVSLIGYQEWGGGEDGLGGRITVSGDASHLRFLVLGVQGRASSSFLENTATGGDIGFVMNTATHNGIIPLPDQGKSDSGFIRSMFSNVRHVHTTPLLSTRPEQTDVRFDQVRLDLVKTGIHLVPAAPENKIAESYSIESANSVVALSGSDDQSLRAGSLGSGEWRITHLDDGGYQIADATTGLVLNSSLGLATAKGTPMESWVIEPVGDGNFIIRNVSLGLLLSLDGSVPAMSTEGGGEHEWKLTPVL